MPDIKRVFGYHGAEHKTINAYEAGAELTGSVQRFPLAHPRCGTAFLLTVVRVLDLLFRPAQAPVCRWSWPCLAPAAHSGGRDGGLRVHPLFRAALDNPIMRAIIVPNLALQTPDHPPARRHMVEVAIAAFKACSIRERAADRARDQVPHHDSSFTVFPNTSLKKETMRNKITIVGAGNVGRFVRCLAGRARPGRPRAGGHPADRDMPKGKALDCCRPGRSWATTPASPAPPSYDPTARLRYRHHHRRRAAQARHEPRGSGRRSTRDHHATCIEQVAAALAQRDHHRRDQPAGHDGLPGLQAAGCPRSRVIGQAGMLDCAHGAPSSPRN